MLVFGIKVVRSKKMKNRFRFRIWDKIDKRFMSGSISIDCRKGCMKAVANHGCFVRYHHDFVGVNSRLDSIQAAILDAKLPHLNDYIAARQRAAAYYDEAFGKNDKLLIPGRQTHSTHVFHQYTLRVVGADRDALRDGLAARGIPAMIYYPVPLHQQKAYLDPRYKDGDFPVAERLAACVLSLPMHTELDEEQLTFITSSVLELINI